MNKCTSKGNGFLLAFAASLSLSGEALAVERLVPSEYATIQAAVDAAQPGDTVRIAAGDYNEQVLISNKTGLTLQGEQGTVVLATPNLMQTLRPWTAVRTLLGIVRSDVTLYGLTIDGDRLASAYPYSNGRLQGITYVGSGGFIQACTIRRFRGATLNAYTRARALVVWNPESAGVSGIEVTVHSNRFEDNEQSITLAGDDPFNPTQLRTTFTVEANTITGFGAAPIAVDGVVVLTGASGLFRANTITDHQYTGAGDPYSSGINAFDGLGDSRNPAQFIPLQPIRFERNTFRNNNDHLVLLNAPNSEIVNNVFEGSGGGRPRWGALAISGADIRVENNDFSNISTGTHLFADDHYFDGWYLVPIAGNPILTGNWFSNVPKLLQIQPGVIGLQQQGTRLAPFQPEFQSIARTGTNQSLTLAVRAWHGVPTTLESSTNLQDWGPVITNATPLPRFELTDSMPTDTTHQFYRLRSER